MILMNNIVSGNFISELAFIFVLISKRSFANKLYLRILLEGNEFQ